MHSIIFPGQGAQYVGMGKSLYDNFDQARDIFLTADKILGFELSKKCFESAEDELKDTSLQQLAILAVSLAAYQAFKEKNIKVNYLSGLSLGEYSCLHAAGSLSLEDLFVLVRERAKSMQEAARNNPSTMFAVMGAQKDALEELAKDKSFYIANINSPKQIVISLAKDNRQAVKQVLESKGLKVIELAVSGGFHSPFMESAKSHLGSVMEKMNFSNAKIPIVSNFTANAHTDKEQIKHNLLEQLTSPVLWKGCIEFMMGKGVDSFFEIGPSKVLKGLMRKINPQVKVVNIERKEDLEGIS